MSIRTLFMIAVVAPLLGCQGGLTGMQPYGEVVFGGEDPYEQGLKINLPESAPSLVQRYVPESWSLDGLNSRPFYIHDGIDIAGEEGAPVLAAAPGTVRLSHYSVLWGNQIMIDHGIGEQRLTYLTSYVHLSSRSVEVGEPVSRGQVIGAVGGTGLLGTFPHLHFSVFTETQNEKQVSVNPNFYWKDGAGQITCYRPEDTEVKSFYLTYPARCRSN